MLLPALGCTYDRSVTDDLCAKVFRDREHAEDWRVEKYDEEGGCEITILSGLAVQELHGATRTTNTDKNSHAGQGGSVLPVGSLWLTPAGPPLRRSA